jgi:hypothetical protein
MQNFINSLSPMQWASIIGVATWVGHTLLDHNKNLSRAVNYFIVRFLTIVVPVLTALAVDPNVSGLVHNYFPALLGFFTAYQGLYTFVGALVEKIAAIKSQLDAGAAVAASEQIA